MNKRSRSHHRLLDDLQERAKELNCLYEVENHLGRAGALLGEVLHGVVSAIPPGFQYPQVCRASISYSGEEYRSRDFDPSEWRLEAPIQVQDEVVGVICVYYVEEMPSEAEGPFLAEERRLLTTIADRLGHFLFYQKLRNFNQDLKAARTQEREGQEVDWHPSIHLLRESDRSAYLRIARRMLNHLTRIGISEARFIMRGPSVPGESEDVAPESNVPTHQWKPDAATLLSDKPFELAAQHLSSDELLTRVQRWMFEDKAGQFMRVLNSHRTSLPELSDAIRRFHLLVSDGEGLPPSTLKSLRASLTHRLLTEQLDFVRVAKDFVEISDFADLVQRLIMPGKSYGKLGGKGAGLVLAHKILTRTQPKEHPVGNVKIPRTWYIASDGLVDFVEHNDLQDVFEQKFKEIDQVRDEYPNIIRLFKGAAFTPRVISGLSMALDDLGDVPIIVRSSSLLEDRLGSAFSGKYKSLFLANQGTKEYRLAALLDAITEVYASIFGPDPIEYRRDHGLLEFVEEMGVLIQEVVGTKIGHYFFPAFAGVAFSNNEFRWSPRIQREDGLVRMVAGLGTRAVDRVADDYPVLAVPGQPKLRANVAISEVVRYSPRKIDVIDLESEAWETVTLADFMAEHSREYPALPLVFSILRDDIFQKPIGLLVDPEKDELIVTFQELFQGTPFLTHMRNMLTLLQEQLGTPVDVEFAHDGKDFYLLQCRPQSHGEDAAPAPIPKDVPEQDIFFSANRYVSNGFVPDITHVVYVDPEKYGEINNREDLLAVGRAVGRLNKLLPKRQFILMGPGRWGSRGDLKLGVSVTYSDISNSAMLIEIARRKGNYLPDLSFGTHFFQDLVEARIRYLPLYPDEPDVIFNENVFGETTNLLPEILPQFEHLTEVVHVVDVPAAASGQVLRVLQNADLDEAVAFLADPEEGSQPQPKASTAGDSQHKPVQYWQWRLRMAKRISEEMNADRFGVEALYVFGSTKNATAGPASDIDLLVHFRGEEKQLQDLLAWLEGWGLCLAELNYLRTGYRTEGLLDVHIVTDDDIAKRNSYAVKIGAVTDAAQELPLRKSGRS